MVSAKRTVFVFFFIMIFRHLNTPAIVNMFFLAIKDFSCYLQIILTFYLKLPFKTLFLNFNAMTLLGFNFKALLTHSMPSPYLCALSKIIAFVA